MRNGDIYEGGFEDGEYSGRGTYACMKEGTVFDGHFTNGLRHGRGRLSTRFGNVFDGCWKLDKRIGLGVAHTASGERQEAWYVNDFIACVPRIFFEPYRALPGRMGHRLAGSSLAAFCNAARQPTTPIRVTLKLMPAWLIAKRLAPPAKAQPGPIKATLEVPFSKTYLPSGGVRLVSLELTQYPRPPKAHARMLLEVQTRPPPESYLTQAYDTEAVKKAVDLFGHLPWPPPPPPKEGQNAKPAPKSKGRGGGGGGGGRRGWGCCGARAKAGAAASPSHRLVRDR